MDLPIPAVIYEHYQHWPQDQLSAEISDLVRRPDREETLVWAALKAWVIHISVVYLRPEASAGDESTKEASARWIAFALRYLLPLCSGDARPITGDRVLTTMQTRPNLVRLMLYGTPDQLIETLRLGLNAPVAQEFADEANLALYVQHSAGVERTVRKWADQIVDELQRTVLRAFVNAQAGRVVLASPRALMPTSLNPLAIGYRATLEWYAEHVPAPYRLQALGYQEEFNARIELANFYLRQLLWSGFFALLIILGLLPAAILQQSGQARLLVVILTAMLLLVYGLMFAYIRYVFTMAQAALRALRHVDDGSR